MGKYSLGAIVRMKRYSIHISQEKISDGICSVETISRMENGKQIPIKSNYELLMERMGSSKVRAYSMLTVADFDILDRMKQFEDYIQLFLYEKADKVLISLEKMEEKTLFDQQFLQRARTIVDYRLKRIPVEEFIDRLDKAIKITIPQFDEVNLNSWPFNRQETLAVINIASGYAENGNIKKSIELLNNVRNALKQGYMDNSQSAAFEISICTNLSKCYSMLENHEKAIQMAEEGIWISKKEKIGSSLPLLLYALAWDIGKQVEQKAMGKENLSICVESLREAYYIAGAMNQNYIQDVIRKYCDTHYKNIKFI